MKMFLSLAVIMSMFLLQPFLVCVLAGELTSVEAIQFLETHKPLPNPSIELAFADPTARKASTDLFIAQIAAIHSLKGTKDFSVISVLVPYLHYTDDASPTQYYTSNTPPPPTITMLEAKYPALAIIMGIPNAGVTLSKYILDVKNPMHYRIEAFHVLRYLDLTQFNVVRKNIDQEFSLSGPITKQLLKSIEEENQAFEAIYPMHSTD